MTSEATKLMRQKGDYFATLDPECFWGHFRIESSSKFARAENSTHRIPTFLVVVDVIKFILEEILNI